MVENINDLRNTLNGEAVKLLNDEITPEKAKAIGVLLGNTIRACAVEIGYEKMHGRRSVIPFLEYDAKKKSTKGEK